MGGAALLRAKHRAYASVIGDQYNDSSDLSKALKKLGIDRQALSLIIGIDFSKSNLERGEHCYEGRSLHDVSRMDKKSKQNPYCQVMSLMIEALEDLNLSSLQGYGFGDTQTGADFVFSLKARDEPFRNLEELLERYGEIANLVSMAGPSSLAPVIRQAIKNIRERREYHILLIIADGHVSQTDDIETQAAIQEAARYPLSIVMVGVGDGPWGDMAKYDDKLRQRVFDNFQFMQFDSCFLRHAFLRRKEAFALEALMEVPTQYKICKELGYLRDDWELPRILREPQDPFGPPDAPNPRDPNYGVLDGYTAVYDRDMKAHFYADLNTGDRFWDKPVSRPFGSTSRSFKRASIVREQEDDSDAG